MKFKDFIGILGQVHSSNQSISEETTINVATDLEGCDSSFIEGEIDTIDYDFKTDTLTILCKEE